MASFKMKKGGKITLRYGSNGEVRETVARETTMLFSDQDA